MIIQLIKQMLMPSTAPAMTEHPHGPGATWDLSEHTRDTNLSPPSLFPKMRKERKKFLLTFSTGLGFHG